jgi:GT2 family glycosyltransferase
VVRRGEPPTISVAIAVFNAAETLPEAVHSALAQSRPAHEVIVVDDGSTDDVAAALEPFTDRVRLIRKENGGAASARNVAVDACSGEFVAFLDADDVFHPRRLEAMAELSAARPDLDIVATDAFISVNGIPRSRFSAATPFPVADQRTAILETCFVTCPAIRVSRLQAIGGFDEELPVASDWDCLLRLILDGAAAGCVPEPYYEYRQVENSLTSDRVRALHARVAVLRKALRESPVTPEERAALRSSLRQKATRAALAELETALRQSEENSFDRRRLLTLARSSPLSIRARILLATAAVAPGLAREFVPHDEGALLRRTPGRADAER